MRSPCPTPTPLLLMDRFFVTARLAAVFLLLLLTAPFLSQDALAQVQILINEVDADQVGTDNAEFVELYDGGVGNTSLDGLVLVFFNGSDDASYEAFDLDGQSTDADGFFVLCGDAANVPNCDLDVSPNTNLIQNGADAVALYTGDATDFPNDTPVTTTDLIDAIVYDTDDSDDAGLLVLLNSGQPQVNEDSNNSATTESNQRIPNGSGGARNTDTYTQIPPTPGAVNGAAAPTVSFTTASGSVDEDGGTFDLVVEILNPDGNEVMVDVAFDTGSSTADGTDIDNYTTQTVTFTAGATNGDTETVTVTITDDGDTEGSEDAVFMLENLQTTGDATIGSPDTFTLTINDDETPLPALVINEIDYDQSGSDNAEFLEIKNTGAIPVNLDPFDIELVNGSGGGASVYQTIDLPDVNLAADAYFVVCADAATTINCDLEIISSIQNGSPDAVAIVQGSTIIDAVSYEGDTGAPYTEGSGSGLEDDSGIDFAGISRFPDGADTDMNNVDLSLRCITPGSENLMAASACEEPVEIILVINEVDADTPGTDDAEFIELYDGGVGNVPLDGYVVVLFNGSDDQSYTPAFDLDGQSTDANGFFVICGDAANVPNCDLEVGPGTTNLIQNGADAVALYEGDDADFPNDTPVTTTNLIDAIVYDTNDSDDAGLLVLLNSGQPQVNEDGNNDSANESNQRIPNGEGGPRNTDTYTQTAPTPGEVNRVMVVAEIFEIQGSGLTSPFDGQVITTLDNIVTAVGPEGFFMQTPDARDDSDPLTSNGIYVFTTTTPTVAAGDQVDVTGEVVEFFDFTEFANNPMVTVDNSGNALPTLITFDATTPSPDPTTPSCDGVGGDIDTMNFECFEGMRVEITNGAVASGNQGFGSDPLAEVFVVADATRPFREPGIEFPGMPGLPVWDGNPEIFELDPDKLGLPNQEIPGGSMYDAVGVLGFEFGGYELWPTSLTIIEDPLVEPVRAATSNEMTIGTLNLFRLFDDVDDPADGGRDDEVIPTAEYQRRLTKFSQFIREVMLAPDILAVQEAEKLGVLEALAAEIQADDPAITYSAYLVEGNDIGTIDVGFLVRSTVQVDEVTQLGKDETLSLDGSPLHDRPPLLLEATYMGSTMPKPIAVMNVHNRSLSGIESSNRVRQKRLEQAQSIAEKVQDFQTTNPGTGLAVTGDFNAFQFTDGFVDAVGQIAGDFDPNDNLLSGPDLVDPNLSKLVTTLPAEEQYSFIFGGSAQVLDHMLTTQLLTGDVRGLQYGRSNADAPDILIEDDTTPARASDHDGLVLYVDTSGDPLLNEFVADHTGTDTDEFIELFGEPNTDYSTFTILSVEGDAGGSLGIIDDVFTVGTTDGDGFWTTGFLGSQLENGTMTLLLVKGFTGSDGDDIDTNDDGVIDNMLWARLVDDVAVTDEGAGDQTYASVVLDPNFDNRNTNVGGASRIPNGLDTDSVGDWARNDFDGEGLPSFPDGGTPKNGEAINTPGTTNQLGTTPPAPEGLVINEVDSNTPGSDTMEFIELYDGGVGNVALDNVVVVLFNGEDDASYRAFDLDGFTTDAEGFFVLGNADVPNVDLVFGTSTIQNGPDAVAIYAGEAADFPNGTGVTTTLLVDALVYGPVDEDDFGLRQLLNPNQPQVDENGQGNSDLHSLQRIPNGAGGARNTDTYLPLKPTPGAINGGADLSLNMTLGAVALDGNNITGTFLLTLMNDGPNDATGIVVTNPLPEDVTVVSATPDQGTFDPNTGTWTVGDVANGEAATLMLALSIDQTINFTNFAEVTFANEADPDSDPADGTGDDAAGAALTRNLPDLSGFQSDLSLTKTADTGTASVGDEVVFTLIIHNAGPIISAGVEVTDLLPSGLTYVSDSSDGGYDPATGLWDVGTVAVGQSDTLRIVTTVNGSGTITNTARITASNLPDPDADFNNDDEGEDDQDSATVEVQTASEKATSVDGTAEIPATLELAPNYPNPFNPETTIPFGLPEAAHVTLRVYDLLGRQVEVLVDGTLSAGRHVIRWDAAQYSSGVYLVRIQAGGETRTQRLTLMK